jgi:molybdopterin synthase catalytic subunit
MSVSRLAVAGEPLSVERLLAAVESDARGVGEGCGGLCTFVGVVRQTHQGRRVRYLEYEAYAPLAVRTFDLIAREVAETWPAARLGLHHRTGRLEIGDASVVVVAAAAHRAEAFQVCRYAIERVKQVAPIWKHEFFEDGEAWVEGAVADPGDGVARRLALERACA